MDAGFTGGHRHGNRSLVEGWVLMNALRHGWTCLLQDSPPLAYKYSSSFSAVLIAGLSVFAVAVCRAAMKQEPRF